VSEARAFEPVASANSARARVKDIKESRSEFSVFSRLSSIRRQRMFYQFLQNTHTQVFTVSFDYLSMSQRKSYSVFLRSLSANIITRVFLLCLITFILEVKEYKISFLGAFPKADMKKQPLLSLQSLAVIIYLKVITDNLKAEEIYRRCQLSGGVGYNRHLPLASLRVPTVCSIAHQSCCVTCVGMEVNSSFPL